MTEQQIDRERLREAANEHQPDDHGPNICGDPECFTTCVVDGCDWPCETAWLRGQLEQAESELDSWMARAYEAEGKLWQAEERIKAVQDVIDKAESLYVGAVNPEYRAVHIADIRRALESVPPPSA